MSLQERISRILNGHLASDGGASAVNQKQASLTDLMGQLRVPGMGVTVVDNLRIAWSRAYGTIEAGKEVSVTQGTLFAVESVTKLITAIAALRLVQSGKLNLDTDISIYLRSWAVPDSELLADEKVTLRRLLNHTSGIPPSNFGWKEGTFPTLRQVLDGKSPAKNAPARVQTIPGSAHAYSNLAYVVIQQLLEDVTGQTYVALVQDSILGPLGMSNSTFSPDVSRQLVCRPHREDGSPLPLTIHPSALAQGGLFASTENLARVAIDLMKTAVGEAGNLLRPETVREMLRPDPILDPKDWFGVIDGQGMGLFLSGREEDTKFLAIGLGAGSTTAVVAFPARQFAVILAINAANGFPLLMELLSRVAVEYELDWGFTPMMPG